MPKVSIILPTYNQARYLKKAILSVINQSFKDWELIIINDGSTDNTEQVVKNFNNNRIHYILRKRKKTKGRGEYSAINLGYSVAKGDYLTWIHSDDTWPKDSLKWRVGALANTPYDLVHFDIQTVDAFDKKLDVVKAKNWPAKKILDYYCHEYTKNFVGIFHHTTLMIRRSAIDKIGPWDENLPYAGDLDYMLRALLKCKIRYVPKVVYNYRVYKSGQGRYSGIKTRKIVNQILNKICKNCRD